MFFIGSIRGMLRKEGVLFNLSLVFLLSVVLFFVCDLVLYKAGGELMVHLLDDHMITQRVAWNFHETGLPYFNDGEEVAANTSLFWPIIISFFYSFLGYYEAVFVVSLFSLAVFSLTAFLAVVGDGRIARSSIKVLIILASPSAIVYGMSGWEHIPQVFFVTSGVALFLHQNKSVNKFRDLRVSGWSLLLFSASFVFRPDSAAIIFALGVVWVLTGGLSSKKGYFLAVLLMVIPISYILLMLHFYGDYTPNTASLKVMGPGESVVSGVLYLLDPFSSGISFYLAAFSLLMWKKLYPAEKVVAALVFSHFFYVVLVGGDVFGAGRFVLVVLPASAIIFSNAIFRIDALGDLNNKVGVGIITVASSLFFSSPAVSLFNQSKGLGSETLGAIESQMEISNVISNKLDPSEGSIGLHYLGVAYHLRDYHVVDFLGKADKYIANTSPREGGEIGHNKWDYDYSLSNYNVAVIPMPHATAVREVSYGEWEGMKFGFWTELSYIMNKSDRYVYVAPQDITDKDIPIGLYVRKDLLDKFI